jgi:probable F420-dependent oxidoreductase
MKLGLSLPQGGGEGSREAITRTAREAEALGLDSLWVLDRLLRPVRPISVAPGQPARPFPRFYANVFDPLETLTFAAALTERVQLGTSVINALFHPPVILGKRLATLDQLSGGRVIAGLGQGWMEDEFAVSGVPMSRRGAGMADYVAALRAVWGPDPVHHKGRFYRIPESEIGPKPAQPGGIPILIGAFAPAAIARAGQFADGHNPLAATWDGLVREVETFRTAAREAGRDPATLPIIARANARLTPTPLPDADRPPFAGTVAQWAADLARVAELGIDHVSFAIDDTPLTERLTTMAELRQRVP